MQRASRNKTTYLKLNFKKPKERGKKGYPLKKKKKIRWEEAARAFK